MQKITLILHNIRSTYNVGAIVRTAECLGVDEIYATGYTPHTTELNNIPPFIIDKMKRAIHKTALGAEYNLPVKHSADILYLINEHKARGYCIVALEQDTKSIPLMRYTHNNPLVLILGEEVKGTTQEILSVCDKIIEIPMIGKKESYNVSVATGIALYELRRNYFIEL